ncbi:VWA domain-containing protein [Sulfobacillus sp. hq2]|uniref:VWA domain-containing protein n=1 Tax=Sulfobacillus sp. hq2 TaxID=2039167 RepID=UPI000CD3067F|nr:VWA domain-containing protein [Sulfobacillus sp. hq2]POB09849.1 hypothetical protein CO251_13190 [Sulfobacillus sp. hq2]
MDEDRAAQNLGVFARALRKWGFSLSVEDVVLAARAMALTQDFSLPGVHAVLSALWISSPEQRVLFNRAYAYFAAFLAGITPAAPFGDRWLSGIGLPEQGRTWVSWIDASMSLSLTMSNRTVLTHSGRASDEEVHGAQSPTHTVVDNLWRRRLLAVPPHVMRAYRRRDARRGRLWNLSRLLRKNRGRSEIMTLWHQTQRTAMRPTWIVWDASRSMDGFMAMYFQFLHALVATKNRLQVVIFSTRLTNVTAALQIANQAHAYEAVFEMAHDLRGGTQFAMAARALSKILQTHTTTRSDVVIITDGYDALPADGLGVILGNIARRSHRVVWWNPWLGRDGYRIATDTGRALAQFAARIEPAGSLDDCVRAWARLT